MNDTQANAVQAIRDRIKVDLAFLPPDPDPTTIGSIAKYFLISHVSRTPVQLDRSGALSGDLISSWEIDQSQKVFKLKFKSSEKFSNGDPITAKDFIDTVKFRKKAGMQIHFDFTKIKRISAVGDVVVLEMASPSPLFLYQLTHPEFGVLHKTSISKPILGPHICSGHYCLMEFSKNRVLLKKNSKSFPNAPEIIEWIATTSDKYEKLSAGQIDFVLEPSQPLSETKKYDVVKPHIGFTYWVSLNPVSNLFKGKSIRAAFQAALYWEFQKNNMPSNNFALASQLFLPGGLGRLERRQADDFWAKAQKNHGNPVNAPVDLHALTTPLFELNPQLEQALKAVARRQGYNLVIEHYKNQNEFESLIRNRTWDLYLTNNDFSSFDLSLTLPIAFNSDKPLIKLDPASTKLNRRKIQAILGEPLLEKRGKLLTDLSANLLDEALIVPLVYRTMMFAKSNRLDISAWSQLYPEIAFWKATVR